MNWCNQPESVCVCVCVCVCVPLTVNWLCTAFQWLYSAAGYQEGLKLDVLQNQCDIKQQELTTHPSYEDMQRNICLVISIFLQIVRIKHLFLHVPLRYSTYSTASCFGLSLDITWMQLIKQARHSAASKRKVSH